MSELAQRQRFEFQLHTDLDGLDGAVENMNAHVADQNRLLNDLRESWGSGWPNSPSIIAGLSSIPEMPRKPR